METDLITKILVGLFVAHLVIGFSYMIYKLSPLSTDKKKPEDKKPKSE
jgi:hypothetical protein